MRDWTGEFVGSLPSTSPEMAAVLGLYREKIADLPQNFSGLQGFVTWSLPKPTRISAHGPVSRR